MVCSPFKISKFIVKIIQYIMHAISAIAIHDLSILTTGRTVFECPFSCLVSQCKMFRPNHHEELYYDQQIGLDYKNEELWGCTGYIVQWSGSFEIKS